MKKKYVFLSLIIILPLLLLLVKNSFSITYNQKISSVQIESSNYNDPGTFHINKSARWIDKGKAEVVFDVTTIKKGSSSVTNRCRDVILVIDTSASMRSTKIEKVKESTIDLIGSIYQECDAKVALIAFNTTSQILTGFTNNQSLVTNLINNLTTTGTTNYNAALLNVREVLNGYQHASDRDLVTLFFTDGYPNVDTPNEKATYSLLKSLYPYMTITGIQYEMGSTIIQELKDITDFQYVANQLNLSSILPSAVERTGETFIYDEFTITDYIHDDYFYIDSVNDITVDLGRVTLEDENGVQRINWILDGEVTGFKAHMNIKLKVKPGLMENTRFFPTNKGESVDYEI